MRRLIIITLTLCMLGFSASAFAGGPGNNRGNSNQVSQQRQSGQQVSRHGQTGQVSRNSRAQAQRQQGQQVSRRRQSRQVQQHQAQAQRHQAQAQRHQVQARNQQQHRIAQRSHQSVNRNRQAMHQRSMHRAQPQNAPRAMHENGFRPAPRPAGPALQSQTHEVTVIPVYSDSSTTISGSISTDLADVSVSIAE